MHTVMMCIYLPNPQSRIHMYIVIKYIYIYLIPRVAGRLDICRPYSYCAFHGTANIYIYLSYMYIYLVLRVEYIWGGYD